MGTGKKKEKLVHTNSKYYISTKLLINIC